MCHLQLYLWSSSNCAFGPENYWERGSTLRLKEEFGIVIGKTVGGLRNTVGTFLRGLRWSDGIKEEKTTQMT